MAKFVQLGLFDSQVAVATIETKSSAAVAADVFESSSDYDDMLHRNDLDLVFGVKNPCIGCIYEGLCDSDECAMKLYDLDY